MIFFQQSPKMRKIVSENFIHSLLLFLGLFLKISRWVPLYFKQNNSKQKKKKNQSTQPLCISNCLDL